MKSYDKILANLYNKACEDVNILTFFVHGSTVHGNTTVKSYQEIRIFEGKKFLTSIFRLKEMMPDIDIVCVSKNVKKTKEIIEKELKNFDEYFITINLMSQEVFERDVFSDIPKALKLVVGLKEHNVILGEEYLNEVKKKASKKLKKWDKDFQKEFDFRKEFLKLHIRNDKETFMLSDYEYTRLFPLFSRFIKGEIDHGFPQEREKLVFPKSMDLKAVIDIEKENLTFIR